MAQKGLPSGWEISRFAVLAAGHAGCALKAMRAQGLDPDEKQVEEACEKVKPVIAKLECDVCHSTALSGTGHEEHPVLQPQ